MSSITLLQKIKSCFKCCVPSFDQKKNKDTPEQKKMGQIWSKIPRGDSTPGLAENRTNNLLLLTINISAIAWNVVKEVIYAI